MTHSVATIAGQNEWPVHGGRPPTFRGGTELVGKRRILPSNRRRSDPGVSRGVALLTPRSCGLVRSAPSDSPNPHSLIPAA